MYLEILIVLVLISLNGLLAMSELAVVSTRPARLKLRVKKGEKSAATALSLAVSGLSTNWYFIGRHPFRCILRRNARLTAGQCSL